MKSRVFIFEDDQDNRELFSEICVSTGFEAFAFSDPSEMENIGNLRLNQADIVLTDIAMPVMSGIEFAERIIQAGFSRMNIAVISGFWNETNLSCACRLGIRTFAKPVPIDLLTDWLKRRRDEQQTGLL